MTRAGVDTATFAAATVGVTVDLTVTGAQNTGQGSDTFSGVENVIGSNLNDLIQRQVVTRAPHHGFVYA